MTKEELEQENSQLKEQLVELHSAAESLYSGSYTYDSMKRELEFAWKMQEIAKGEAEKWEKKWTVLSAQAKKIYEDNKALMDGTYQITSIADRHVADLEKRILDLKAEVSVKDHTIAILREAITNDLYKDAEEKPKTAPIPEVETKVAPVGRPAQISDPEKNDMRRLRQEGYSIGEIAEIYGNSKSTVQAIVKSVSVSRETLAQHRKTRNKSRAENEENKTAK